MNQHIGIFKEEKKYSPDIRFIAKNIPIMFKYNEFIKTTEPISLPHTKDVTYTAELREYASSKDYIDVFIYFLNVAEKQKTFTCNLKVFNCNANDQLLTSKTLTSKTLNAKEETKYEGIYFQKSLLLRSGYDCDIVIRIEEVWFEKKLFNCKIADGPCMPDLSAMYQDENFKDITFIIGEGSIMAHKNVLATRSKVFHSMFVHNTKEKQDGVVKIEDFSITTFETFIKYLYTNETEELDKELAEELLMIADKYDIQCLRRECEIYLCQQMKLDDAIHFLLMGIQFNSSALKQRSLFFIKSNQNKIAKSPDLCKLFQTPPHLKDEIIKLLFNDHELSGST